MSAFSDAMAAIRDVVLMQANIEELEKDFSDMSADLKGLQDHVASISMRLARLEGMIEGAAIVTGRQPRLPGE